jgi:hypothetical protein
MIGDWTVRVEAVRPFAIHGDLYYELHVQATGDASGVLTTIRVPQHAATEEPTAGQTLTITFLMGQVTSVKRVDTV